MLLLPEFRPELRRPRSAGCVERAGHIEEGKKKCSFQTRSASLRREPPGSRGPTKRGTPIPRMAVFRISAPAPAGAPLPLFVLTGGLGHCCDRFPGRESHQGLCCCCCLCLVRRSDPQEERCVWSEEYRVKKGRLSAASKPDPPAPGGSRRAAEAIPKGYPSPAGVPAVISLPHMVRHV